MPLAFLQQGNVKKSEKSMKIVNIEGENVRVFRQVVAYDNIKSTKKQVSLSF